MCALNAIRFIRASRKLLIAVVVSTGSPSVLVAALGPKNKAYASSMINTIKKAPEAYALGAFFMLWLWSQPALSHCPADAEAPRERVQVAHIIDGDTVRLQDGRRVRFLGVNAPEAGRDGGPDEPLAEAAYALLAERIPPGQSIGLVYDASRKIVTDEFWRTCTMRKGAAWRRRCCVEAWHFTSQCRPIWLKRIACVLSRISPAKTSWACGPTIIGSPLPPRGFGRVGISWCKGA